MGMLKKKGRSVRSKFSVEEPQPHDKEQMLRDKRAAGGHGMNRVLKDKEEIVHGLGGVMKRDIGHGLHDAHMRNSEEIGHGMGMFDAQEIDQGQLLENSEDIGHGMGMFNAEEIGHGGRLFGD